jgi:hypothetical protein
MSHLNDRTLERLISGSASPVDVQRIRRHVGRCRACARRLEEWRDNFTEVEQRFPELGADSSSAATVTAEGLMLLPNDGGKRVFEVDLTAGLWIGATVMALLVGYGSYRLRQAREVLDLSALNLPQSPRTEPESRPTAVQPPPTVARDDSLTRKSAPTPPPTRAPVAAPRPATGTPATSPAPIPISSGFRNISMAEAVRRLGGPVRLIQGLQPDHVEIGPARVVPGAQSGLDVIRVVYRATEGQRILLDQQLIPADSNGFRPLEDARLESGEAVFGTSGKGVRVATWLGAGGYRLSLAMRTPLDSLKQLIPLVQ